jgi:hypothetical protein
MRQLEQLKQPSRLSKKLIEGGKRRRSSKSETAAFKRS